MHQVSSLALGVAWCGVAKTDVFSALMKLTGNKQTHNRITMTNCIRVMQKRIRCYEIKNQSGW